MRVLTLQEVGEVAGGYGVDEILKTTALSSAVGTAYGLATEGTAAAGTLWGMRLGTLGFAYSGGYAIGTWLYNTYGDWFWNKFYY